MIYLSQLLGNPVLDAAGEQIGTVNDLGIATGEVFPRVTSLAFLGPGNTPFMISWRKYVDSFDEDVVHLKESATDIRFSYLQPDEVLIARDLLNKQIVDTRGMKVVRVNDLKLSDTSSSQLRLLGAEVGVRGLLRSLSPAVEKGVLKLARAFGKEIPERVIAWNYMDLLERNLSNVKLSVTHKTLDELHPADIADIMEQLDPRLRGQVFAQLDDAQAAEAMAELDDDQAAELMGSMAEAQASKMLSEMDPDDAAELVSELDYEKAEKLLRLMGVNEQRAVRQLLGYREDTAGRIMTSEFVSVPEDATVRDATRAIRELDEDFEAVNYVYLVDADRRLKGILTLRALVCANNDDRLADIATTSDLISASPEADQEDVAQDIAKYNLLAMPIVDENNKMLGIVTVDDALDVLEEEHEEDLAIAGARSNTDSSDDGADHLFSRVFTSEMWYFCWMVGVFVLLTAALLGNQSLTSAFAIAAFIPVCTHVATTMVRYVTNFFLEYDEDDEDAPSLLGFTFKGLAVALCWAAVVVLVSAGVSSAIISFAEGTGLEELTHAVVHGLRGTGVMLAAGNIILSFATAPLYLVVLRARDKRGLDTDGFTLRVMALVVSTLVFVGVACALMSVGGVM